MRSWKQRLNLHTAEKRKEILQTRGPGIFIRRYSPARPNPQKMAKMQAEGGILLDDADDIIVSRPSHNGAGDPNSRDSSVHDSMD